MTSSDFPAFSALMDRAAKIYRPPSPVAEIVDDYWRALEALPLGAVETGLERFLERGTRFPKPAEWRESCPRGLKAHYPVLSPQERREYLKAQANGWDGPACGCAQCVQAGVSEKPTRYVPIDSDERAWLDEARQTWVVSGEWIHGFDLARFYQARADFYEALFKVIGVRGSKPRGNAERLTRIGEPA